MRECGTSKGGAGEPGGAYVLGSGTSDRLSRTADLIAARSTERWGERQRTTIIGRHASVDTVLEQATRFARSDSPVLITGETGTGKELFARAIYLLSPRWNREFLSVNCAQYRDSQLISSELFGHKRGSFTGAVNDHQGIFETAEGGVVFLDEIGELSAQAQALLLRLFSEGEILPVGANRSRRVNVRTVMATNRNLKEMVDAGTFRADLYYRLRQLNLRIPPVRERGNDWRMIVDHYVEEAAAASGAEQKQFSPQALAVLGQHDWPGNVRELRAVAESSFHLSDGLVIGPESFGESLESVSRLREMSAVPLLPIVSAPPETLLGRLLAGEGSFWALVHEPFLERDLNRHQVRDIVAGGLSRSGGSYKRLLALFGIAQEDYLKFMDFLRHHRLKPTHGRSDA
ncbi:MAG: sigma-54-dependent Fis family transcriptional regulator [Myxococcales bacterium]|nr:sigma-54-dependent Fis family transcriptional regulator [Myxococcales bacterium]